MIIEIGYSYQLDKSSPTQESWTYFYVKSDDFEVAQKKAKTYWKKFITELGWVKKAKLIHIEEIRNAQTYTPSHIVVSSDELAPARRRKSTPVHSSTRSRNAKQSDKAVSQRSRTRTSSRTSTSSPKKSK